MHDEQGGGRGSSAAEELILRTVAAHADSLLRTARRHSICTDDAQDAYQRALEIFMAHADRLDSAGVAGWLHVVVKREAQAIRRSRKKLVGSSDVDFDAHDARLPTPEERLLSSDLISRSAEALQRLKPQELRALWLKAEGHSYNEIGAITGWSYTKVNRCLTEGRRSFLERYADIECGAECERWMPVISAIVDGEATQAQILELRPHLRNCPGCRATLRALQDSSAPLSVVLPIPLVAGVGAGSAEQLSNLFMRAYEAIAGGLHERAVHSVTKAQSAIEAAAGGKVAAVAASAAAAAGGGYATVERTVTHERANRASKAARHEPARPKPKLVAPQPAAAAPAPVTPSPSEPRVAQATHDLDEAGAAETKPAPSEFEPTGSPEPTPSPEPLRAASATAAAATYHRRASAPPSSTAAPQSISRDAGGEFGP